MNPHLAVNCKHLVILTFLLTAKNLLADDGFIISPNKPTHDGNDFLIIKPADGSPAVVVTVPILRSDSFSDKKAKIAEAINDPGNALPLSVQGDSRGGGVVLSGASMVTWVSDTGERQDAVRHLDSSPIVPLMKNEFHFRDPFRALSGLDSDGQVAVYTAGFDFNSSVFGNITLSSSLAYSDLTTPTLTGLVEKEYQLLLGQLLTQAPTLAGALSLDLQDHQIGLRLDDSVINPSVYGGTTDVSLYSGISFARVPEQTDTFTYLGGGLLLIFGHRFILRSTRKEKRSLKIVP